MEEEETILVALTQYHASEGHEGNARALAENTLRSYREDVEWNLTHQN